MENKKTQAEALLKSGLAFFYREQHKEAAEELAKAAALDPDNALIRHSLGNAYYYQNHLEPALKEFQRAVELAPEEAHYHFLLGNLYVELARYKEALSAYAQALALENEEAAYFHNQAEAFYLNGDFAQAATSLKRALELDPNSHDGFVNLYLSLRRAGADAEAESVLARFENVLDPKHWLLPVLKFFRGQAEEKDLIEVTKGQINLCKFYYYLGMNYLLRGDQAKAREYWEKALRTKLSYYPEYRRARRELDALGK